MKDHRAQLWDSLSRFDSFEFRVKYNKMSTALAQ